MNSTNARLGFCYSFQIVILGLWRRVSIESPDAELFNNKFHTFVLIRLFVKVRGIAEKLALKLYSRETGQKVDISAGNQFGTILTGVQKYSGTILAGVQKYCPR